MQANLMLLLAAAIWGLGFVAQRFGMDHLGPYSFNALRFFIGALSLVPLIWWYKRKGLLQDLDWKLLLWGSIPVGVLLLLPLHCNRSDFYIPLLPMQVLLPGFI